MVETRMWSVCVLLLASAVVLCTAYKQKRIIGGSNATSAEFPYMGSLQAFIDGEWIHVCGSVPITTSKALTAAHCLGNDASVYRVVFGTIDITNNEATTQIVSLSSFTKHPSFTSSAVGFSSDIAVLRFATTLDTSGANVGTISLASGSPNFTNTDCAVLGWGALSNGQLHDVLQSENVTVISEQACDDAWSVFGVTISSDTLCATADGFSEGDSGGPLVCMGTLAGLVSYGGTCAGTVLPNVFTSISFLFSWIQGQ